MTLIPLLNLNLFKMDVAADSNNREDVRVEIIMEEEILLLRIVNQAENQTVISNQLIALQEINLTPHGLKQMKIDLVREMVIKAALNREIVKKLLLL